MHPAGISYLQQHLPQNSKNPQRLLLLHDVSVTGAAIHPVIVGF